MEKQPLEWDLWCEIVFDYSEWLDQQGLVLGEEVTGDPRSHEDLVRDFMVGHLDEEGEAE